jgi:hypothetical protein
VTTEISYATPLTVAELDEILDWAEIASGEHGPPSDVGRALRARLEEIRERLEANR